VQDSKVAVSSGRRIRLWMGSLTSRLAILLAAFIVLATVAVVLREYGVGEERLVAETTRTLSVRAVVAADRLEGALAERQRLIALWAALESSQDLAVDDVDLRLSQSLADLVSALGDGTEAVAARDGVVLSASDPARLGEEPPALPSPVLATLDASASGVFLHPGGEESAEGAVLASADVFSGVDGHVLGRIVAWTPLERFLSAAIPLELDAAQLSAPDGTVLARGGALDVPDDRFLWASHTAHTVAGEIVLSMGRPRADVTRALHQSGRQLLTLAALFLLLALPTSLVVTRTATSSLGRLTRAARELDAHQPGPIPEASPWAPSEVHVLAEAMSSMVSRLEEARTELARSESLAAMGMLTKSLAHEIRTPLSVLRAGTEILARAPEASPRTQEVTEMLGAEVERLSRLVGDLLVFGRPSPPRVQGTDLREIAAGALEALEGDASEHGIGLSLEGEATPLRADPDQLRQVVLNLTANAVRACERDGHVVVRVGIRNGSALLDVEDDGVGIPPEQLDDIWKPLFTSHRSGNGLGLPIVRQLVEAHGGDIDVRSTPDEGTRMRVKLPLQPVEKA